VIAELLVLDRKGLALAPPVDGIQKVTTPEEQKK
jgi:hypothetical protein